MDRLTTLAAPGWDPRAKLATRRHARVLQPIQMPAGFARGVGLGHDGSMGAALPRLPPLKDLWPILFLVGAVALHPVPGGLLLLMGVVSLWSKRAPGRWPWHAAFWEQMQWTLAGALGIFTVGVALHVLVVRPIFSMVF